MTGPDIHREVLDNLRDGVLVVRPGGRIESLDPAAERLLDLFEVGTAEAPARRARVAWARWEGARDEAPARRARRTGSQSSRTTSPAASR